MFVTPCLARNKVFVIFVVILLLISYSYIHHYFFTRLVLFLLFQNFRYFSYLTSVALNARSICRFLIYKGSWSCNSSPVNLVLFSPTPFSPLSISIQLLDFFMVLLMWFTYLIWSFLLSHSWINSFFSIIVAYLWYHIFYLEFQRQTFILCGYSHFLVWFYF